MRADRAVGLLGGVMLLVGLSSSLASALVDSELPPLLAKCCSGYFMMLGVRRMVLDIRDGLRAWGQQYPRSRIAGAPLARLDRIAYFCWSEKTYSCVFKPMRADIVHEWNCSMLRGEQWRARWIKWVRGPFTFFNHVVLQLPWSVLKKLGETFRGETN